MEAIQSSINDEGGRKKGWAVVLACLIFLMIYIGVFTSCSSIFVKPVTDDMGISRGAFSLTRTLTLFIGAVTIPMYSSLMDRLGIRKIFFIGAIVSPLILFGYSISQTAWQLYIFGALHGLLYNSLGFFTVGELINRVFKEKAGTPLGIVYAGSGLGSALAIPILNSLIESSGWRTTYQAMGLFGLIIGPALVLCVIKDVENPFENAKTEKKKGKRVLSKESKSQTYLLVVAFVAAGLVSAATSGHAAPYVSDIGYSAETAALYASGFMLSVFGAKMIMGFIYGHFRPVVGNTIISLTGILGIISLMLCRNRFLMILSLLLLGLFNVSMSVPIPILAMKYFRLDTYKMEYAEISTASTLACAVSLTMTGVLYDFFGSYTEAWRLMLICSIIAAVCLLITDISYKKHGRV